MSSREVTAAHAAPAPMSVFERCLTVWVFACILVDIATGGAVVNSSQDCCERTAP